MGVRVDALNLDILSAYINRWIKSNYRDYIVLTGAHGIVEMQNDRELKKINNLAGLVTPDGMPEVWLGKLKGLKNIEKVYAGNAMHRIFQDGLNDGYKHFFYGGSRGVARNLARKMKVLYPEIIIVGTYCPPFRPLRESEKKKLTTLVNGTRADIVWCGLGCPKQEKWMADFRPRLIAPVLIGVGAGFDFLSGAVPLAPKFIQNSGFEWMFRMLTNPRKLIKRYLYVVPVFTFYVVLELLGLKKFSSDI